MELRELMARKRNRLGQFVRQALRGAVESTRGTVKLTRATYEKPYQFAYQFVPREIRQYLPRWW